MSDPKKKNDAVNNDSVGNLSDDSDYHNAVPYAKTPSPPLIPTRGASLTPAASIASVSTASPPPETFSSPQPSDNPGTSPPVANATASISTTSSVSSRLGHLDTQKKMHSQARQSQAARNSITSITAASSAPSQSDNLISNKPHDDERTEEDDDVEKVLAAEMVSDEELSARDLEAVVNSAYFDLFVLIPLLIIPSLLVFFMTDGAIYDIVQMKDPNSMNSSMEFIRYNVFATIAYALYVIFDVLSLAIPEAILLFTPASKSNNKTQKFIRSQLQMVINIRTNFALSTWLFSLIFVASFILYQSIFTSPQEVIRRMIEGEITKTITENLDDKAVTTKLLAEGKNMIIQRYIEIFLVIMAIFSTVLAIEKYLIQMIKLGFHKEAFADRISSSNLHFGYLLKLYEGVKFGKPRVLSSSAISLLDIDSAADLRTDKALNLTSIHRAKSVSKLIFRSLLPADSSRDDYLIVEDFEKWTSFSKETFECFDLDHSGKLREYELEEAIVNIYTTRNNLFRGLKSNGKIVNKLDGLLLSISFLLAGVLTSPIFDVGVGNLIGFLGVLSTGFGFLFHSTAKSCFESILFVFIQHPFDVGDRVIIDDENFVIEDIEVFTTKMTRWDGVTVYIANTSICSKVIQNIRRSENQLESLSLKVTGENPTESLWNFRQELEKELKDDEGNFTGEVDLANLDHLPSNGEALAVTVLAQIHGNFQNPAKRNARKAKFLEIVETALKNSNLTKA